MPSFKIKLGKNCMFKVTDNELISVAVKRKSCFVAILSCVTFIFFQFSTKLVKFEAEKEIKEKNHQKFNRISFISL